MPDLVFRILLHLVCFVLAFYALEGLDFTKILRKGQSLKALILLFLLSMALGYLVAQFLLMLAFRYYF